MVIFFWEWVKIEKPSEIVLSIIKTWKIKTYPANYQLQCPNGWKFDPLLVAICGGNHVWLSCWYIQTIEFGWLQELVPQLTQCYLSPMPRENNVEKLKVAKFQKRFFFTPIYEVLREINKQIKTIFVTFIKIQRYQGTESKFRFPQW